MTSSIEQAYDALLVPRIFEPWAKVLLDRLTLEGGIRLLDVATGSGPVAREAAKRLGPQGKITATDFSAAMLDIARAKPQAPGGAPIDYLFSPAAPLRVETMSFDIVTCQQSLQFFPDKVTALREMKRALKPGGQAAIAVWTEIADNTWFAAIHKVLSALLGPRAAAVINAPFQWPHRNALEEALVSAGFAEIKIERLEGPLIFEEGVDQAMLALDAMPIAPLIANLPGDWRNRFEESLRREAEAFVQSGKLVAKSMAHIATARS